MHIPIGIQLIADLQSLKTYSHGDKNRDNEVATLRIAPCNGVQICRHCGMKGAPMFSYSRGPGRHRVEVFGGSSQFARALAAVVTIAGALLLTACGGGGGDESGSASVNIGVLVAGQSRPDLVVGQGGSTSLAIFAGDSVILKAREPVIWTLFVGGAAVGTGVEVFYAGLNLTATRLDAFAVALDTFAAFPLAGPVGVTMVATSTFDSALVARVDILVTN